MLDNKRSAVLHNDALFGKAMLHDCMAILHQSNTAQRSWKCFHANDAPDYTKDRLLTNETVDNVSLQTMRLVPMDAEEQPCAYPSWFTEASREQLLGNGNTLVSKLWRWSLLDETPFAENDAEQVARDMPTVTVPRFWVSGWVS